MHGKRYAVHMEVQVYTASHGGTSTANDGWNIEVNPGPVHECSSLIVTSANLFGYYNCVTVFPMLIQSMWCL